MIDKILQEVEFKMGKSLDKLSSDLSKIRTGRAHPGILDHVKINYYNSETSINQIATVAVLDFKNLVISPWEKGLSKQIEKAIVSSNIGLNPIRMGDTLKIPIPALNEERRKNLAKLVKSETENCRITIRKIRRSANAYVKELIKGKKMTKDEAKRAEDNIQQITDKIIARADMISSKKELNLISL